MAGLFGFSFALRGLGSPFQMAAPLSEFHPGLRPGGTEGYN
jgi:hypothetical protein